jgi:hypothetical protein
MFIFGSLLNNPKGNMFQNNLPDLRSLFEFLKPTRRLFCRGQSPVSTAVEKCGGNYI